jgi:hypothetical protein
MFEGVGLTMNATSLKRASITVAFVLGSAGSVAAGQGQARWFADRPIAWHEHDDADLPTAPASNHLQAVEAALTVRDSVVNEADRILALEGRLPAEDVNAIDEVPCSTWFCARHHLRPMSAQEIAAGPAVVAPRLPLTIVKGKDLGAASGYQVKDAAGRRFMLKFDVAGHPGLANAGELIGSRIFHAAGYNVPGAVSVDLDPADLKVGPTATFLVYRVQKRPLTAVEVRLTLANVARLPDGRIPAVVVPWIPGSVLGGFDMLGVRTDDRNDRIPHQHRRSLRASRLLFAWLAVLDPSSINTMDSYVEEAGRRFVRHYVFDFGCAFGSATTSPQGVQQNGEYVVELGRTLAALFSLGLYRRPFQDRRHEWIRLTTEHPALGYFPAESFDPDSFRTAQKLPPHMRLTDRDAYWGAKLVTAFSDEQIAALVSTARLPDADARYLDRGLRIRRDIIGRRYLRAVAAVENPSMAPDGTRICFEDLAIARGYAPAAEVRYLVEADDGLGNPIARYEQDATGPAACVPIGGGERGSGYRVVAVRARFVGAAGREGVHVGKAAQVHLRWRESIGRFVIVGLERDE